MFTGVTEAIGEIVNRETNDGIVRLVVSCPADWKLSTGQSIAVDGACLTVVESTPGTFTVDVMPETIKRTKLEDESLAQVNLERAMPADGRFEGHIVQGHIDCVGKIESVDETDGSSIWKFSFPGEYQSNVIEKGSIAIDGVSLTIIDVQDGSLIVGLIPHTLVATTFGQRKEGDAVQFEFDIIGKYYLHKH